MTSLGSLRQGRVRWVLVGVVGICLCRVSFVAGEEKAAKPQPAVQAVELKVQPGAIVLDGPRDARRVLVSGRTSDGTVVDLSRAATYTADGTTVKVDKEGFVQPVKDGATKVIIAAGGKQASVAVTVKNAAEKRPVSFVRDVMPAISKIGCNAGTCHGAAKGRNGFKLSLRGYDPEFDYHSLVEDISGRRFNRSEPAQSLMLLKPTQGVPHEGGQVLVPESAYYALLNQWIAGGVQSDVGKVERVRSLEVLPAAVELVKPDEEQQTMVIAHYSDGTTRDVSREAIFSTTVPDVATVSAEGLVTSVRRGEAALLVRYEGAFATSSILVLGERKGFEWAEVPRHNYIDKLVYKKLRHIKVLPAELCTDAEFIRRVYLDLVGQPPGPEDVRAFISDPTPQRTKRDRLIDRLIGSAEFVEHWTQKWADLLQCNRKYLGDKGVWSFRNWIRQSVAQNTPYNEFARELLTAAGSSYANPSASYFLVAREPDVAVEHTTQLFLGVRFMCAKCHDHPFEKWTQNDYYGLAAYFAQVGIKRGSEEGEEVVYDRRDGGDVTHPKSGNVVKPAFPYAVADAGSEARTRRRRLAEWFTSAENPLFARSMANRMWSYFLGRGIIEPVDDVRSSNPPSNPELLDALADDFVKHGFDLQHLARTMVRSRVYQHSFKTNQWNAGDKQNFAYFYPRRLAAEQLLDAISVATQSAQKFPGLPVGFRAAQLPDSQVATGGFLDLFGRPPRESPCECERSSEVSLSQALNLVNGPTIAEAVRDPNGRVAKLAASGLDDRRLVEEIYLAVICRPPTEAETEKGQRHLASAGSKKDGLEDLMWALVNSPAFLFNR